MLPIPTIEPHRFDLSMVRVEFHVHGAQNRRKPILPSSDFHGVFGVECDFRARDVQAVCNRNSHPCNRSARGV